MSLHPSVWETWVFNYIIDINNMLMYLVNRNQIKIKLKIIIILYYYYLEIGVLLI